MPLWEICGWASGFGNQASDFRDWASYFGNQASDFKSWASEISAGVGVEGWAGESPQFLEAQTQNREAQIRNLEAQFLNREAESLWGPGSGD